MTICIAAICDNGGKVVVCSDRMVTSERYMVKFEQGNHKILSIESNCVLVSAGDSLASHEIVEESATMLEELRSPSIAEIADILKTGYISVRGRHVDERIRGQWPRLDSYSEDPMSALPEEMYRVMSGEMMEYELEVDLLVGGVDRKGGHIYRISHPGTSICFDPIGQHAIGAGEPHAVTSLFASGYDASLPLRKALFLVYTSKKVAEKAPGVGTTTDMCFVDITGTHFLKDEELAKLEEAYLKKIEAETLAYKEIESIIDSLSVSE